MWCSGSVSHREGRENGALSNDCDSNEIFLSNSFVSILIEQKLRSSSAVIDDDRYDSDAQNVDSYNPNPIYISIRVDIDININIRVDRMRKRNNVCCGPPLENKPELIGFILDP